MLPQPTNPGARAAAPPDEELVLLARAAGAPQMAFESLLDRHGGALRRYVAWWIRTHVRQLRGVEAEEAAQEGVFAFVLAVATYKPAPAGRLDHGRFRAFLWRVVHDHLSDWVRRLRRAERCLDRSRDAALELDERARRTPLEACSVTAFVPTNDPAVLAAIEEAWGRLEGALEGFGDAGRRLWDGIAAGRRLDALAAECGLSYDQVKRLRRRLLARAREVLT